ncbi:MAG: hypothetical protein UX91_C0006G0159 [Candidatus Amesbacteria bacterium GW2011_GWB1_47_19]|nr:MAG: hypothetical protein UW51_C0002G0160 [Candidatus Amesbacteria bacterium GW2011_GWA1_44_24]KKU31249.1 MAG: hypothetical protein UX46_C0006G0041 [Candidatus Amesbacteria bacterium GW2011_GWC1_46_24]KKU67097.1 MAG: hypothetical protein UX91_C0006G0159 [Candidatus Amesbacteria bacterium GW2011_GWB1_47_19]OGD04914.1 MAG: hypothetical protein A2379_04000 [Candidatus Amesbacteria bacterium RIFOXYB1_FULL_47_13]HBC72966.1 hypothetical protein [Candidatus Amesbacteria bacterium]
MGLERRWSRISSQIALIAEKHNQDHPVGPLERLGVLIRNKRERQKRQRLARALEEALKRPHG